MLPDPCTFIGRVNESFDPLNTHLSWSYVCMWRWRGLKRHSRNPTSRIAGTMTYKKLTVFQDLAFFLIHIHLNKADCVNFNIPDVNTLLSSKNLFSSTCGALVRPSRFTKCLLAYIWDEDENQDAHQQVYGDQQHEAKFSHELIGGAAAFEGMKLFEDRQRQEGKHKTSHRSW